MPYDSESDPASSLHPEHALPDAAQVIDPAGALADQAAALTEPETLPVDGSPGQQLFGRITAELRKIYVGQDELVLGALVALFSGGHVLIESVPGLGKTLFVRALGRVLGC